MIGNAQTKKIVNIVSPRVLVILLIFLTMVCLFGFITNEIVLEKETGFDEAAFHFLEQFKSPNATKFFIFITFFGSGFFLLPAYLFIIVFYVFFSKNINRFLKIIVIALSSTALLFTTKYYFQRQRPVNPLISNVSGFSFPSGHSFSSFILCGIVIYIIVKSTISLPLKWLGCIGTFTAALLIAISRVYLRVHYASDALAGFCLSLAWLTISFWVLSFIFPQKQTQQNFS